MEYKIFETAHARADLEEILEYITGVLANPTAAAAFADELEKCYGILERMPLAFEQCRDGHLKARGYRKALVKNYVMIYKVTAGEVIILRFFHGSRDYEKLI